MAQDQNANKLAETQQKLAQALEQMQHMERLAEVGRIAAGIGHELRNPLASMKNIAYFLKKKIQSDDAQINGFLDMLSREVNAANRIVTNLLDFSNEIKVSKFVSNLEDIVDSAISSIELPDRVRVAKQIAPDAREIFMDPERMKKALGNLLVNAAQAMPQGGDILVGASRKGDAAVITVKDTGHGIKPDIRDSIFNPLFSTRAKGIGIGLSIVKNIVEKHNGTIAVESEEGKGTTFIITLPQ